MPSGRLIVVWVQHFKDRPFPVLQWHDPVTGKRCSKSAGTADPREVEARRRDLESDLNNARYVERGQMTWKAFRRAFEAEWVATRRENTRKSYAYSLDLFEELAAPRRPDLVTARTLSQFRGELHSYEKRRGGRGLAPATIKLCLAHVRAALRWAAEQELIARVPKFPRVTMPERRPQPVPEEAFEKLLAKVPDAQWRAYLLTGWLAGLRLDEAYNLERAESDAAPWLDLAADRIRLPADFAKGKEDQWVPLDPKLRAALEALPAQGRKVFRFRNRRGGVMSVKTVSALICRWAKDAGVRLSMHKLRKGFGCAFAGEVPAQVLQKLMRHSSLDLTMRYYANVDAAVEEAVRERAGRRERNAGRNDEAQAPAEWDSSEGS